MVRALFLLACLLAPARAGRPQASALTSSVFSWPPASPRLHVPRAARRRRAHGLSRAASRRPAARNEAQAGGAASRSDSAASRQYGAAKCAFLRFLILTSAHRARSGGRRTAETVRARSKRAGLVPSGCASVWHPGLFQGRYCPPSTGALNPASAAREPAPASNARPLAAPTPGTRRPAAPRAVGCSAPRRPSAPPQRAETTGPRFAVDADRMFVTSRQSGSSTAHVDGGAPHVYSRPRNCALQTRNWRCMSRQT